MKKVFSILLTAAMASSMAATAQLSGDGYYRISNVHTNRYVYIVDNTGSINVATTTIEAGAIELWKGIDRTIYDPATVLYIEKHDKQYDIKSQSTGIYQILSTYVNILEDPRNKGTYYAYGTKSGMAAYLWDAESSTRYDESSVSNNGDQNNPLCRNWYITPIDNSTANYFGVKPTVAAGNAYYANWYADFPFTFQSSGMNAYYVTKYDNKSGLAVYKEVTGTIPARTPLIIKCSSDQPVNNKLNIGGNASAVSGNLLTGVFFNCYKYNHNNRVPFDKNTMRVLGKTASGELALVKADYDYVPRNTFYLKVPSDAPADIRLVTEEEYEILTRPVEATSVTLSAASLDLTIGQSATITATVNPANTTDKTVNWTSSNTAVATVDATGKVTAINVGTATITAKCGNVSATCQVKVNPILATSVVLTPSSLDLKPGETSALSAQVLPANTTDKTLTWTSSNPSVATVDAAGKVTAVNVGTATITAKCGNVSATCQVKVNPIPATSVVVTPSSVNLKPGETSSLSAQILPANTTDKTVNWTSSNTAVATVDATGKVTALSVGNATITAACGQASGTCVVTVSPILPTSIVLSSTSLEMLVGDDATLTATVTPDNTTDKTIVWESSNSEVAQVVNGAVHACKSGETVITAKCGNVSASCAVKVSKHPQTITWNQEFSSATEGDVIKLLATASSGYAVTYTTSENARVDGDVLTILAPGEVKVTASQAGDDYYEAAQAVTISFSALAGISDAAGENVVVKAHGSAIIVEGKPATMNVYVYNLQGQPVYAGTDSRIAVQPGCVYIVKVGAGTFKVAL